MKNYSNKIRIACLAMAGIMTTTSYAVVKENNTDNLELGSSWVGGIVPTGVDVATWDATVTGANAATLGLAQEWNQIQISGPGGPVTINGSALLTLRSSAPIAAGSTTNLTINTPLDLAGVTGSSFFQGAGAGTTVRLAGALTLTNNVSRINFDSGGANGGAWELGGISSFTNEVRLGGSGNRLGIGSSSTAAGGPLGFGPYLIQGGSASIYTYAYGGNQTISNDVSITTSPYFDGANNLTLASKVVLSTGSASTRPFRNQGSGTVNLSGGFTNGAIQVLQGKFTLGGVIDDPTGGGTSGNTKVQGAGAELILVSGGVTANRIRGHDSGTLTIKPTVADGVFTTRFIQLDSNPTKPILAFDFTAVPASTTVAPLNAPGAQSSIFNPTDVSIRGTATQFPIGVIPLIQYASGTSLNMGNLPPNGGATLILPTGLAATLTDSTTFPNTLELTITSTNDVPPPPVITVQPQPQAVPSGGIATFTVTAVNDPLTYQWYDPSFSPISGATNATLVVSNVSAGEVGNYTVEVSNPHGTVYSDPAELSLLSAYTVPNGVFWTGVSNTTTSDLNNYGTNSLGEGSPVSTLAGQVIEYSAAYNVATLSMNADALTIGAFHSNTNRGAGNGYNLGGSGPWTITRATVESANGPIPNAAVVVDHPGGGGWRITPDLILDGGGEFVFSWNNDNWGEIQSQISESGGVADLVFTGNGTPVMIAGGALNTSGRITITNSTDLSFRYDFDISTGPGSGELVIYNDASHFDLRNSGGASGGVLNTFKVKTLTCVGASPIPAGTYTYDDLVALDASLGSYFYGNVGAGDTIIVTEGAVVPPAGSVITSVTRTNDILTLTIAGGQVFGSFDLLESTNVTFVPVATNQSWFFDDLGQSVVTVTNVGGNKFFRVQEFIP